MNSGQNQNTLILQKIFVEHEYMQPFILWLNFGAYSHGMIIKVNNDQKELSKPRQQIHIFYQPRTSPFMNLLSTQVPGNE
jgi:hypothetical protein